MGYCIASMKDVEDNSSTCPTEQLLDVFFNLLPSFLCCPFKSETPLRTVLILHCQEISHGALKADIEVSSDEEDAGVLHSSFSFDLGDRITESLLKG